MTKTILTIDDHPDTIQLIELALQRHGYRVIGAFSGPEGIEVAQRERPDLILLDMMMPGMDGNAVCRSIRQNPDIASTPIIMFTAKGQAIDKKDSFDAGADDYLTKPTRPSELLQRIESLLSRQHGRPSATEPLRSAGARKEAPYFISVMGARGGAGATTVAVNLAATFAEDEVKTILVDLDTQQGHAAIYLGHDAASDLVDWLNQPAGALDDTLPDYLVHIQANLLLMPSRLRLAREQRSVRGPQVAALTASLDDTKRTIVVDAGGQPADVLRPILQRSDVILICLRPERAAIVGARRMIEELPKLVDPAKIQLLLLDYAAEETIPRAAVESYLQRPLCAVMQLDPQELTRAVNRHQPLIYSAPDGQALQQFRELAAALAASE